MLSRFAYRTVLNILASLRSCSRTTARSQQVATVDRSSTRPHVSTRWQPRCRLPLRLSASRQRSGVLARQETSRRQSREAASRSHLLDHPAASHDTTTFAASLDNLQVYAKLHGIPTTPSSRRELAVAAQPQSLRSVPTPSHLATQALRWPASRDEHLQRSRHRRQACLTRRRRLRS